MGELSLGRPKGGRGRLIEVQFSNLFYNYFGTFDYWLLGWLLNAGSAVYLIESDITSQGVTESPQMAWPDPTH